jgi:tetratricopeptide (TPR) repeat protein
MGVAGLVSIAAWLLYPSESGREPQRTTVATLGRDVAQASSVLSVSADRDLTLSEAGEASVLCDVRTAEAHGAVTVLLIAPPENASRVEIDALRADGGWDLARYDSPANELLLLSPKGFPALEPGRLRMRISGPAGGPATLRVQFLGETEVPPPFHVEMPVPRLEECFAPGTREEARELVATFRNWVDGSLEASWVDPGSDLNLQEYEHAPSAFSSIKAHAARDANPRARLFAACLETLLPGSPRQQFKAAAAVGANWLKRSPSDPYAHWLVGRNAQRLGEHASAQRHLQIAVSLLPREAQPRVALASSLVKHGELRAAAALVRPLLNRNPKHALANVLLGQIRFSRGESDWEQALGQMVFGCEQYVSDARRHEGLSRVADRLGEIRTRAPELVARTAARLVELLAPQVPIGERGDLSTGSWIDLRVTYGRCLALAERPAEAIESLREVEAEIARRRRWKVPRRLRKIQQGIATIEERSGPARPPGG